MKFKKGDLVSYVGDSIHWFNDEDKKGAVVKVNFGVYYVLFFGIEPEDQVDTFGNAGIVCVESELKDASKFQVGDLVKYSFSDKEMSGKVVSRVPLDYSVKIDFGEKDLLRYEIHTDDPFISKL